MYDERLTFTSRLQPFLYRRVRLRNDHEAKSFVECQLAKSLRFNVEELYLGPSISTMTTMDVLELCPKVRTLTTHFSYKHIQEDEVSSLLEPLGELESLKMQSVRLASVVDLISLYLPMWPVFHRLTHFHLATPAVTASAIPLGLAKLNSITHLSFHWYTSYSCTSGLLGFLAWPSTKVLLLWCSDSLDYCKLEDNLRRRKLADRRVMLLQES